MRTALASVVACGWCFLWLRRGQAAHGVLAMCATNAVHPCHTCNFSLCFLSSALPTWSCGLMDKALVLGTKDCRFESCQDQSIYEWLLALPGGFMHEKMLDAVLPYREAANCIAVC